MSGTVGGRWIVVRLEERNGPVVEKLGEWGTYDEALARLDAWLENADKHEAFGVATCEACGSSDEGCEVCR